MSQTTAPEALRRFVDDELLRVPLFFGQAIEATLEIIRTALPRQMPAERAVSADLLAAMERHRPALVAAYVESLRMHVRQRLEGAARRLEPGRVPLDALGLVDEADVAVDVELSHAMQAIASAADAEARELETYAAALAGDPEMARPHNPFGPDALARALWAAMQALPMPPPWRIAAMRHAAQPHAGLVRKVYAAASARLADEGVEPASYRTIILPSGVRRPRASEAAHLGPGEVTATQWQELVQAVARSTSRAAGPVAAEVVSRLFGALLADPRLPRLLQPPLARLLPVALRAVASEPRLADDAAHPLWLFVDRLAHQFELIADDAQEARERVAELAGKLVDHLDAEGAAGATPATAFAWALERVLAIERHRLRQQQGAIAARVESLARLDAELAMAEAADADQGLAIDLAHLETVPAELYEEVSAPLRREDDRVRWLAKAAEGDAARVFLQGQWVKAQLLWLGREREVWLFGQVGTPLAWPVRRRAVERLVDERLLAPIEVRSFLRRAAARIARRAPADSPA
jgi:hypothetical protein